MGLKARERTLLFLFGCYVQPVIVSDDDVINTALSQVSRLEQLVHCSPVQQSASSLTSPVGPGTTKESYIIATGETAHAAAIL